MNQSLAVRIAGIFGFAGVSLGAFGAHGLHALLTQNATVAIWEKAVLYHLVHAVVLLVIALHMGANRAFWCVSAGILIFSGTLYTLALTNIRWLGAITPIGGLLLLAGWLLLVLQRNQANPMLR